MKNTLNILISGLLLFLISCEPAKKQDSVVIKPVNSVNELFATPAPALDTNGTANSGAGLNPAHGQPGHSCAIPVGAPLNAPQNSNVLSGSTPTPTSTPITSSTPTASPIVTPVPTQSAVVGGINPAHGQPGHDCSIKVGMPLKK